MNATRPFLLVTVLLGSLGLSVGAQAAIIAHYNFLNGSVASIDSQPNSTAGNYINVLGSVSSTSHSHWVRPMNFADTELHEAARFTVTARGGYRMNLSTFEFHYAGQLQYDSGYQDATWTYAVFTDVDDYALPIFIDAVQADPARPSWARSADIDLNGSQFQGLDDITFSIQLATSHSTNSTARYMRVVSSETSDPAVPAVDSDLILRGTVAPKEYKELVTVVVDDPGNAAASADNTTHERSGAYGFGAVPYEYQIGKYHVTNAQYVQFLNNADPNGVNPNGIYNAAMQGESGWGLAAGGITFDSDAAPGHMYVVRTVDDVSRGDWPVVFVSWYDAARFTNWLTTGDPELGVYVTSGNWDTIHPERTGLVSALNRLIATEGSGYEHLEPVREVYFLPSEDEWYKAAYYDPDKGSEGGYWLYPFGGDPTDEAGFLVGNGQTIYLANYGWGDDGMPTDVGQYEYPSPYGTYDQGGNVWDWNDTWVTENRRGRRGGSFYDGGVWLRASDTSTYFDPWTEHEKTGFRIASIPEPGSAVMLFAGVLGLLLWRRRR